MLKLQTPVMPDSAPVSISYEDRILVLGSCFADEIGSRLAVAGVDVRCNPFGTLYNPVSIGNAIARLSSAVPFTEDDVVEMGANAGKVCSLWHHTAFARDTAEAFLASANAALAEASAFWKGCNRVVVTLGTAWAFRFNATGETVANCLKRPGTEFTRYRLSVHQTAAILNGLAARHPNKQFIFTVSPLRHIKDGLHGNQLSKAALLLAVDEVCKTFGNTHYFPAYEILLDELRDYRFYKEDMVHPTEQAVRHIWERFVDFAIDPAEKPAMKAAAELKQMLQHRPMFPKSEAFRRFELLKEKKTNELTRDFPKVRLENL